MLEQLHGTIHCIRLDCGMLDASQFRGRAGIDFPAAVREYFREVLAMVESSQPFETLAHIDYPKRYWLDGLAPYQEKDYEAEIRAILAAAARTERDRQGNITRGHTLTTDQTVVDRWPDDVPQ